MCLLRIQYPALRQDAAVADSRRGSGLIGIVGSSAGEQDGQASLDAEARSELVENVYILQIDLVHDLVTLLHPVGLLDISHKVFVRELVPVADVQLPFPGGQISTLLDVACNRNVAFTSSIPGARDGANHGRR